MFSAKYTAKTKQAKSGLIKHDRKFGLDTTKNRFRWRAAQAYNDLPLEIRSLKTEKIGLL